MLYVLFADWVLSVGSEICTLWAFRLSGIQDEEHSRRAMAHILLYLCHLLVVTSLIFHRLIGTWTITSIDSILWFLSSTILLTFLCYRLSHDDEELGNVLAWLVEIIFRLFAVYFEFSRRAGTALDLADSAILDSFGELDMLSGEYCGPNRQRNQVGIISSTLPTTVSVSPNQSCEHNGDGYIAVYFPLDRQMLTCISLKPDPLHDVPPSYEEVTKGMSSVNPSSSDQTQDGGYNNSVAAETRNHHSFHPGVEAPTSESDLPVNPPPYESLTDARE